MHSATKYLNGHSDAIAGALCFARGDGLAARVADIRKLHGLILGPFEAFLLIRGLRTLDLRVRAAAANAFCPTRMVETSDASRRSLNMPGSSRTSVSGNRPGE